MSASQIVALCSFCGTPHRLPEGIPVTLVAGAPAAGVPLDLRCEVCGSELRDAAADRSSVALRVGVALVVTLAVTAIIVFTR